MKLVEVKFKCSFAVLGSCDEIGTEDEDLVTPVQLAVDGLVREIDICKNHREYLITNMLKPLMADGRTVEKQVKKRKSPTPRTVVEDTDDVSADNDRICEFSDCVRNNLPFETPRGLAQHVSRSHGYASLDAYREDYPLSG